MFLEISVEGVTRAVNVNTIASIHKDGNRAVLVMTDGEVIYTENLYDNVIWKIQNENL